MVWVRPSQYSLISLARRIKQGRDALLAGDLLDALLDLIFFEPIGDLVPLAHYQRLLDVREAVPMCVGRGLFPVHEVDDLPAQTRKLIEQRLLDVAALVKA